MARQTWADLGIFDVNLRWHSTVQRWLPDKLSDRSILRACGEEHMAYTEEEYDDLLIRMGREGLGLVTIGWPVVLSEEAVSCPVAEV